MNWFFLAAALALCLWFFALLYLKSFVRRRTSADHILGLLQEEVRQLEAVIDEKTEQTLQLLEEKIQAMRELCSEAERRIALYGRELEKREKEAQALAALDRARAAPEQAAHGPVVDSPAALYPEKKRAKPARRPPQPEKPGRKKAHQEGSFPEPRSSVPLLARLELRDTALEAADSAYRAQTGQALKIVVGQDLTKQPPVKDRITELYRAGFAPELIAKRLGLPLGEVNVYVNLFKLQGYTQGNPHA